MIQLFCHSKGTTTRTQISSAVRERLTAHCLKANMSLERVIVQIVADSGEVTEATVARYLEKKHS